MTGPGGVGKTRLALRVVADLAGDFADGVHFVPFAAVLAPDLVLPAVAQALGLVALGGQTPAAGLRTFLRERQVQLVLDNVEHVVGVAPELADLLASCPGLTTLVTSWETLRIDGEQEVPAPSLALPDLTSSAPASELASCDAVALFLLRAQAVKPDFVMSDDNATVIAELCIRLDGLPLAIELAAARSKMLSPRQILVRLADRLTLLLPRRRRITRKGWTSRARLVTGSGKVLPSTGWGWRPTSRGISLGQRCPARMRWPSSGSWTTPSARASSSCSSRGWRGPAASSGGRVPCSPRAPSSGGNTGTSWGSRAVSGGMASVAALTHRFERAARLFGAAEALREAIGAESPRYHTNYDRVVASVRAGLGDETFAAAWAAGHALPLVEAVTEAMAGTSTAPSDRGPRDAPARDDRYGLTAREIEVLRLITAGRSNPGVAEALFISPRTAQTHVQNFFAKIGVNSRTEAARLAVEQGLV